MSCQFSLSIFHTNTQMYVQIDDKLKVKKRYNHTITKQDNEVDDDCVAYLQRKLNLLIDSK